MILESRSQNLCDKSDDISSSIEACIKDTSIWMNSNEHPEIE